MRWSIEVFWIQRNAPDSEVRFVHEQPLGTVYELTFLEGLLGLAQFLLGVPQLLPVVRNSLSLRSTLSSRSLISAETAHSHHGAGSSLDSS